MIQQLRKADMADVVNQVLTDPDVLPAAFKKAVVLLPDNGKRCAATQSFLLIDVLGLPLQPEASALKLAYVLMHDFGLERMPDGELPLPGYFGVCNSPQPHPFSVDDELAGVEGDVMLPDAERELSFSGPVQGAGFDLWNPDPAGKNEHHIYLVVGPDPQDPSKVKVADNLGAPHYRNIGPGGPCMATAFFIRAPA